MTVNATTAAILRDQYVLVIAFGGAVSGTLTEYTDTNFTVTHTDVNGRVTGSQTFAYADVEDLANFYADDDVDGDVHAGF